MNFNIAEKIIAETECDKEFSCLHGNEAELYHVEKFLGPNMLILECNELLNCRHYKAYGRLHLCNCPTRIAIYKKYGQ